MFPHYLLKMFMFWGASKMLRDRVASKRRKDLLECGGTIYYRGFEIVTSGSSVSR